MDRYQKLSDYIVPRLREDLPSHYVYHSIDHILDVLRSAERLAAEEGVNGHELELLRVGVLFHDSGFLVNPDNHEYHSCELARKHLPDFDYAHNEIEIVCGLIMATKIPQSPKTHLEEIICDADLDYLGRDDFYTTGRKVFLELVERGKMNDEMEWNKLQVQFLNSHNYFTDTSRALRKPVKEKHLEEVIEIVEGYKN